MEIFVETERILLREILPSDDRAMFELDSDPAVQRFVGNKPMETVEQAREIIEYIRKQYLDYGIGRWAIIDKASGGFIGWAGLKLITETINDYSNYYDLGYRLLRRWWGKGYASEASKATLLYGFNRLKLHKIFAMANVFNQPSQKVLEKVGFTCVSTFDYNGEAHYWFEIEKESFLSTANVSNT